MDLNSLSTMADAPVTRPTRLRQFVGRFDLRMNQNRFGLIRHTIKRATEKISNHTMKRKMQISLDTNNNANIVKNEPIPIFAVKKAASMTVRKWNQTENRPRLDFMPKPVNLYDTSNMEQHESVDEEMRFEQFNQMSLNELCKTAEEHADLKFATQKFFEVMYTTVKLDWLIDDGDDKFTLLQVRRLLQCFGSFISTLIINTEHLEKPEDKEDLLTLIDKHCPGILFWDTK